MDQIENSIKTEESEEPKSIDDYFGYDIKQTLEEIEYNMEGLSLTIVMEPCNKESSKQSKQFYEYKLSNVEEEEKPKEDSVKMKIEEDELEVKLKGEQPDTEEDQWQPDEDLLKLVERIELRQKDYEHLFNIVMGKLKQLQEQHSEEDYKFSIIKRNKRLSISETLSESSSDSESSESDSSICEKESIRSSDSSSKRKTSSEDSDSETDQKLKNQCSVKYPFSLSPDSETIIIGPSGTEINRKAFQSLQWKDAAGATRELCNVIFGERTLATHSLTGNQSPAFRGRERPIKAQLDSDKTSDITHFICSKFNVTQQLVRATITTKCADAAKKIKRIKLKKNKFKN